MRWVIETSLKFRLLVVVIAAGVLVLGVTQLRQMPADVLPEDQAPVVQLQTESLGLSAPEVEQLITVPMEDVLNGILGVTAMRSNSIAGLSAIDLYFARGTSVARARQLVQERLTALALANVSTPPQMLPPVSSQGRVMIVGLTSTRLSMIDLSVLARWTVRPRLMSLPGVANVALFGELDRQLQVRVDPARLIAHRVTLAQVISTAGNAQLVSPLTYLEASTPGTGGFIDGPNQRLSIRHVLPSGTPADLAQVPVDGTRRGGLRLGDVATVVEGHQPPIGAAIIQGQHGLMLVIEKLPGANTLAVTHEVDRALAELQPGLPGVHIDASVYRAATYLSDAWSNLEVGVLVSALLAALAIGAFFLRIRQAVISLVAIAGSLITATLALDQLGYTFNALVIVGLVMALAVIVDDAVSGLDAEPAAADASPSGSDRIIARLVGTYAARREALCYAALIVAVVAAPAFFASGLTGAFLHPMLLAYVIAVGVSLLVALTVTPALGLLLHPRDWPKARQSRFAERIGDAYAAVLNRSLGTPRAVLAALCIAGLAGLLVVPSLGQPHLPGFRDRSLVVHWSAPPGAALGEMDRISGLVSHRLAALPGVDKVGVQLGRAVTSDQIVGSNTGELWVTMRSNADYTRTLAAVQGVVGGTPGMRGAVTTYEQDAASGVLSAPASDVRVRVYGTDYGVLTRIASQLRAGIASVRSVSGVDLQQPVRQPAVEVMVNLGRALRRGIKPGDVRREAATLISGITVGNLFDQQKVFDVLVRGTGSTQHSLTSVRDLMLDTPDGGHVRLGDIAQVGVRPEPVDIAHDGVWRYVDVLAHVRGGDTAAAKAGIERQLAGLNLPLEYRAVATGPSTTAAGNDGQSGPYLALAAIASLLLLQALLGSWRLAGAVFCAVPVGVAGGVAVALVSGEWRSLGAAAGLLALVGLSARQAIGLLSGIEHERRACTGPLTPEVVVRAMRNRLTPTLASAVTTACVLAPFVVYGDAAGFEITHTTAAVILGGLVTATGLNLVMLPALYLRVVSLAAAPARHPSFPPVGPVPQPGPSS